jgi:hypothetical protein
MVTKKLIIGFFCMAGFLGCSSSTQRTCLNERTIHTVLRWGDYQERSGVYKGFELHASNLKLYRVYRQNQQSEMQRQIIDSVNAPEICRHISTVINTFTDIQSLYSPGPVSRAVEYVNNQSGISKRAVWNPQFQTFGSKEFRAVYDSLLALIPASALWPADSSAQPVPR